MSLQLSEYEGLEGSDANVTVCSELLAGILERGVTVDISTSDITAVAGTVIFYPSIPLYAAQ